MTGHLALVLQLQHAAPSLFQFRGGADPAAVAASVASSVSAISPERRADLLRAAVAREHVELTIEALAYTQVRGERNRNSVRFAEAAIKEMASVPPLAKVQRIAIRARPAAAVRPMPPPWRPRPRRPRGTLLLS